MTLEAAFLAACAEELAAPKPGNVHVHADGHGMTVADFLRSAEAAAPALCRAGAALGERIFEAVAATRAAVGQNTNLGIVLLCAPLLVAAEQHPPDLRSAVGRVLDSANIGDAEAVFAAIRLAAPGGLGEAPRHDVRRPATVTLAVAMAEAARRDSIARQWTNGFADVFGLGTDAYAAARRRWREPEWAALAAYLAFLAAFPDSHVLRKHGPDQADHVRLEAEPVRARVWREREPSRSLPALLEWDRQLKRRRINPGTSADLTVATVLGWQLAYCCASES
ncbi:MAG: triphosphoribosyl-dephospho-CoA synthase [Acetobacteraceae bacterium]|nr:triphosphoribosyl-dephospho-CoA synthase [Acetobacteraceae bacterium]